MSVRFAHDLQANNPLSAPINHTNGDTIHAAAQLVWHYPPRSALTNSFTRLPSLLPETFGITSFMTLPRSWRPVAPASVMLARIRPFTSSSERGGGT